jgi:hypothetical protein
MAFGAFFDRGQMVTPAYWGDHWPLSRGKLTRYQIHDGVFSGPAHNSFMGWTRGAPPAWIEGNPAPLAISRGMTIDTLGRVREMQARRWAWLIAKSDAPNDVLLRWAHSFSEPPALEVTGARLAAPAYSQERRAIRLVVESSSIGITIKPAKHTMNPVFELDQAPPALTRVTLGGMPLAAEDYAWDGATLWVRASIDSAGAKIGVDFAGS